MECLAPREKLGQQDRLVWLVQMAHRVLMVQMAILGNRELLAHLARLEHRVNQVKGVHHPIQAHRVFRGCQALLDHHLTPKK